MRDERRVGRGASSDCKRVTAVYVWDLVIDASSCLLATVKLKTQAGGSHFDYAASVT